MHIQSARAVRFRHDGFAPLSRACASTADNTQRGFAEPGGEDVAAGPTQCPLPARAREVPYMPLANFTSTLRPETLLSRSPHDQVALGRALQQCACRAAAAARRALLLAHICIACRHHVAAAT